MSHPFVENVLNSSWYETDNPYVPYKCCIQYSEEVSVTVGVVLETTSFYYVGYFETNRYVGEIEHTEGSQLIVDGNHDWNTVKARFIKYGRLSYERYLKTL